MQTQRVQGFYCEILKEEPLSTLEPEMTSGNSCVLESTSPFFGYYLDAPMGKPDPHIYCVLDKEYSLMEVWRAASMMNENRRNPVTVDPGRLFLQDRTCQVCRIKNILHFNQVPIVQQGMKQHGIGFKKKQRTITDQMAIIRLSKILYVDDLGEGMFMDAEDDTKAYFKLPAYLSWDEFKALTTEARYDTSILYFDAAQATIIKDGELLNLVRIYKKHITPEHVRAIRDRYLQVLK